ncbi:zinc finger protein-like [Crotalus adamanteus]|uniref:Zinc finger protein-like n=1 Tax=Crotalus adamanteus TaxID=8729 RepID=A0AAW1CC07_CROAD
MYRPGSSPPATRVQRSRLGPIDSSRGFGSRSRSPSPRGRHHRSPPSRRSSHRSHRSPSPRRFSRTYSLDQPSYSPRQRSRSPHQRSESSVEKYLRALIENGTSSPADNLSNVNRDDSSEKTPAVPLKSILKKRSDNSSTQDSGNFSKEKEPPESTLESVNQHGDFLLPHERASQDGSGFSDTVGIVIDSTYTPDKRLDPFPDNIEDEEKFLYGDDDGDSNNCLPSQKLMLSEKKEPRTRCKKRAKRRKCDEKNQTAVMQMIAKEREALTCTQISQQKKLFYQKIELDRLSEQQVVMLLKKGKKEDPLLMELSKLKENIAKAVAQLEMSINAIKEKQVELNKAAHILEMNFEKSEKLSSENKDSSENNLQNNPQSEERTFDSVKS